MEKTYGRTINSTSLSYVVICIAIITYLASYQSPIYAADAGVWTIGGKVSVVETDEGYGVKTGIKCEYRFLSQLTWRTDIDALFHSVSDLSRVDISIPSNCLWYPSRLDYPMDPYIGPGLTFVHTWDHHNILGINVLAGVNFRVIKDQVFGIEMKYSVPILPDPSKGQFELGLTGTWELSF